MLHWVILRRGPWVLAVALLLGACTMNRATDTPGASSTKAPEAASAQATVSSLLELLHRIAGAPSEEQSDMVTAARSTWLRTGATHDGLAYAVALGAPEHLGSNPVEASRLLNTLLAREPPEALSGDVRRFAEVLRGEYAARTALYAEIARQKDMAARELRDSTLLNEARIEDLSSELARLRRERDEARRKLQAITDIERQLIEKEPEPMRPEGSR
jgi:hypothetical protein